MTMVFAEPNAGEARPLAPSGHDDGIAVFEERSRPRETPV
jgi:hypothetical protein